MNVRRRQISCFANIIGPKTDVCQFVYAASKRQSGNSTNYVSVGHIIYMPVTYLWTVHVLYTIAFGLVHLTRNSAIMDSIPATAYIFLSPPVCKMGTQQ